MNRTKTTKRKRKVLTEEEKLRRSHIKDIRTTMLNIGFNRINGIDGNNVVFKDRKTEFDDIFVYENLIVLAEYTSKKIPSEHLINKKVVYDSINENHREFIDFALKEPKLSAFKDYYSQRIVGKYDIGQLRLRIIYCSIHSVDEHKVLLNNNQTVLFYDYDVVQYFKQLSSTIKRSARYELFVFLNIEANSIGPDIIDAPGTHTFEGNILPVEKSSYKDGYNVVSFYIDADSLMRRAYVLRQESWRENDACGFYQRMVDVKKINSMRKYLSAEKRVFINNIIATLSVNHATLFDSSNNLIQINEKGQFEGNKRHDLVSPTKVCIADLPNIIGIIDGQHRVYAYHEGVDIYEEEIAKLRKRQHLLVTAVLFPQTENLFARRKFEAALFREINNTQTNIQARLKQQIDLMISPFSTTAIGTDIINKLNESGPLAGLFEMHSYEKGKLKYASIVSFALCPLVKYDDTEGSDSLYKIWKHPDKAKLNKDCLDVEIKKEYVSFCAEKIRNILIALKRIVGNDLWHVYDPKTKQGQLSVTFINGVLNVIRCQIKDSNPLLTFDEYYEKLKDINLEQLRQYKSSQYNKMGHFIYKNYIQSSGDVHTSEKDR